MVRPRIELAAGFWQLSEKHVFCSINMRAVLRQGEWRAFFRHLTNKSAIRIQAGGKPGPVRYLRGKWL